MKSFKKNKQFNKLFRMLAKKLKNKKKLHYLTSKQNFCSIKSPPNLPASTESNFADSTI